MQDRFGPLRPSDGVARRRTGVLHGLGYDLERLGGDGTVGMTEPSLGLWGRWSAQLAALFAIAFVIATVAGALLWPQAVHGPEDSRQEQPPFLRRGDA